MNKIVIVMTRTYSGGNLVLRLLGKFLKENGFNVKIFPYNFEDLNHPNNFFLLLCKRISYFLKDSLKHLMMKMRFRDNPFGELSLFKETIFPCVDANTIVVYSEGVYGNPLRAKNVVRWFLYHNRFPNNPEAYNKNELVFSYREIFNDRKLNPTCRLLTLNYFNSELYKQTNYGERNGVCYIIRKGRKREDLPVKFDGPVIDDLPEKEKVEVFNRCKYCYDYDTQTFYSIIAAVCGCVPVIVMEPGKTKVDYLGRGDFDYGRAYGNSDGEIKYAIQTRSDLLKSLDYIEENEKNVKFFIKEIKKRFEEK